MNVTTTSSISDDDGGGAVALPRLLLTWPGACRVDVRSDWMIDEAENEAIARADDFTGVALPHAVLARPVRLLPAAWMKQC